MTRDSKAIDYTSAPIAVLDASWFRIGQRIAIGLRPRWHVRVWKWLTKNNLRVAAIDHGSDTFTLERCR